MGAGEKRPSTTAISSARIAIGWLVALREDSAGAVLKEVQLSDHRASVSQPKRDASQKLRLISPGIACY